MQLVRKIAIVPVLALVAAGCAGADGRTDAPAPDIEPAAMLQSASRQMAEEPVELTFSIEAEGKGQTAEVSGEAAVDPAAERAHVRVEVDGLGGWRGGGELPREIEIVVDGRDLYVKGDGLPEAGWLKVDARHAGMRRAFGDAPFRPEDPGAFLEALRAATDVQVVGEEEIRGVATTHLRGSVDLAALIASVPMPAGGNDPAADAALGQLEAMLGGVDTTFDIWLDGDRLPRRIVFSLSAAEMGAAVEITVDVLQVGGDVDIDVPSRKEVTDLGKLDGGLGAATAFS